jgi:uncharacterized protein YaeQ
MIGPRWKSACFSHAYLIACLHSFFCSMALKSTIYKASLQIANMDSHYYADHQLNIACHPSETLQRMMIRILVFALNAHDSLEFGKGISDTDEPDLWRKDLTGTIEQWIEVGQPDERRILKACGRSAEVRVYLYAGTGPIWWKQTHSKVSRANNLQVFQIAPDVAKDLEQLCERTMQLQVTIQDGEIWVRDASHSVQIFIENLLGNLPH